MFRTYLTKTSKRTRAQTKIRTQSNQRQQQIRQASTDQSLKSSHRSNYYEDKLTLVDTDASFTIISSHKRGYPMKFFGSKVIPEGTKAAIWDRSGQSTIITGPKKVYGWGKAYEELPLVTATPSQFIRIVNLDGTKNHIPGPTSLHFQPLVHKEISVLESMRINAHEAIVLYKDENGKFSRKIVNGPASHMPSANEWIHRFSWHGSDPINRGNKVPEQLQFIKLRLIADQMYLNVPGVRTQDDALLSIQLMIFYNVHDIEMMLDSTHDPIGDLVNAASSDVIHKIGSFSFLEFKQNIQQLNNLEMYSTLLSRAKRIGYNVEKVVFRGYKSTEQLEKMHNNAIELRTQLTLEGETQQQQQKLTDYKLAKEVERLKEQQSLEHSQQLHKDELEKMQHDQKLKRKDKEEQQDLQKKQREQQQELLRKQKEQQQEQHHQRMLAQVKLDYYKEIAKMGVDLTQLMVAETQKAAKFYKFTTDSQNQKIHLHNEDKTY